MNILVYKCMSSYGVASIFTDEISFAFKKLGHNAVVVDLTGNNPLHRFNNLLNTQQHWDFVFSFNSTLIDLQANNNRSIYDVLDVPFVAVMLDNPCHHIARLNNKINHLIVTCVDKAHLDFLSIYYPQGHIKVKKFSLHGGSVTTPCNLDSLDDYLEKRTIPFLFSGSFRKLEKTWAIAEPDTVKLLDDMVDCILGDETTTLVAAYKYVLKQRGIELDRTLLQDTYHLFCYIDEYIRGYIRQACLENLGEKEVPVILYGKGWDDWLNQKKYKSIKYFGEKNHCGILNDLQKTRLSFNCAHNFIHGAHERDFNAMLNGAVSVTQSNPYYNGEFTDGEDIILYKVKELDSLPDKIYRLLDNPETTWKIAKAAKEKAQTRHTWLHRAEKILDMVSKYKGL